MEPALHLVRHGAPAVDRARPAATWELDPAGFDDVWALRQSGRLPARAAWFTSPEPKAVATAQLLTEGDVGVLEDLREQDRQAGWVEDFDAVLDRAYAEPAGSAYPGWEPLDACRDRVVPAVRRVLDMRGGEDVVLVGHGTAWSLVLADLIGEPARRARRHVSGMPALIAVPQRLWSVK